jgi:hypothetical protein
VDVLLPVLLGLAVVPFILGIRAYRAALLRRGAVKEANRRPLVPLAVGLVALVGVFFWINAGVANHTLFEAQVPATGDTAPAVLTFTVPVEHPGAQHQIMVNPRDDGGSVDGPIDVAVRLIDPEGTVLVDERVTLDTRDDSDSGWVRHYVWDDWNDELVPTRAGDHTLTVTVLSPHVPEVHVWVGDDEKTDGQRIPGY